MTPFTLLLSVGSGPMNKVGASIVVLDADELERGLVVDLGWNTGWGGAGRVCLGSPLAGVGPLTR